jgi:hypothetical protein
MDRQRLSWLLKRYKKGKLSQDQLLRYLQYLPFSDLRFAKVDHHRAIRCGLPEVIFCEGKLVKEVKAIAKEILAHNSNLLATRATYKMYKAIHELDPRAKFHERARCITVWRAKRSPKGYILIVTAGTSDIPVAEEARVTAEIMGSKVGTIYDIGVAGIHRLLRYREELYSARVLIVVAGMEGALASVVGGLVRQPVIAVPTSIGYGASFKGIAPLLTMMNSCAAGVAVVNIDNGFGAGYIASLINLG